MCKRVTPVLKVAVKKGEKEMDEKEIRELFTILNLYEKIHEPYFGPEHYAKVMMIGLELNNLSDGVTTTNSHTLIECNKEEN